VHRHPDVLRARLVVDNPGGNDRMTLHAETAPGTTADAAAIVATIRDVTKLRGEVRFVAAGEWVNDGKVVDDVRKYD
jgi:phenylacetate-CoA ligase